MRFRALETELDGPVLIAPEVIGDERGFFCETYRRDDLATLGIETEMVQDNQSRSRRGVVRGMHLQVGRGAAKLVHCARGEIYDVVVDVRPGSPTYGRWESFELSDENLRILYVPVGFGHGFCVVSDTADVVYKQDAYWDAELERGFHHRDPDVGIDWPIGPESLHPSPRDAAAPRLSEIADELRFEAAA